MPVLSRRQFLRRIGVCAIATGGGASLGFAQSKAGRALQEALADALAQENPAAISGAVAAINTELGSSAGIPEVPDEYIPIPKSAKWLTVEEAAPGFEPWFKKLQELRWWNIGLNPLKLAHPLREPAYIIFGNLAAHRAKLQGADRGLQIAKEAADFLIWAQEQGVTGVFPFPASRGISNAPEFQAAERRFWQAEKAGRLGEMVINGWAINDLGDGGLQFDNAECGVALFELYEATRDKRYLRSAREATDWALRQPLVQNWNYNSFSVYLLARAFSATGETRYLEAATNKALLGVIPGQLTEGPYTGRWADPHNAKPSYHYIMLRSLAELAQAMSPVSPDRTRIMSALRLGLIARNRDFLELGAPNKDKAIETLLLVNRSFADDTAFLRDTFSSDALDALAKLVSAQARRGNFPLGPREWGQFLEYVVWKNNR
jgi:hypothetical protein